MVFQREDLLKRALSFLFTLHIAALFSVVIPVHCHEDQDDHGIHGEQSFCTLCLIAYQNSNIEIPFQFVLSFVLLFIISLKTAIVLFRAPALAYSSRAPPANRRCISGI
ncbi:MAG: hypothetical protein GX267_19000 [Fibrobacter sp.]|jgi:hypothetical protein|nr:hypothetical protein [Fibrobacter sp.]